MHLTTAALWRVGARGAMPLGRIQCVVFDLDDTLWSTAETLQKAHEVMCSALKLEMPDKPSESPEQFRDRMVEVQTEFPERKHDYGFCRREALIRMTGDAAMAERVFATWHAARNAPKLFEGVEPMLRRLKERVKLGTLTDGNANPFTICALKDIIDFHVSSVEAGAGKPDKRMFQLCEAKSGYSAEELVMVGDSLGKDIKGAQDAGWRAIWVHPPACAGSSFDMASVDKSTPSLSVEAEVDRVAEVEEILLRWGSERPERPEPGGKL